MQFYAKFEKTGQLVAWTLFTLSLTGCCVLGPPSDSSEAVYDPFEPSTVEQSNEQPVELLGQDLDCPECWPPQHARTGHEQDGNLQARSGPPQNRDQVQEYPLADSATCLFSRGCATRLHLLSRLPAIPVPGILARWHAEKELPEGPEYPRFHPLPTRPMLAPRPDAVPSQPTASAEPATWGGGL
jgi:hypothetical protein